MIGLEPSNVQLYTDRQLIIPAHNPEGQGQARLYSKKNLVELLACKKLVSTGMTLNNVKFIMEAIRSQGQDKLFDPQTAVGTDEQLIISVGHTDENPGMVKVSLEYAPMGQIECNLNGMKHIRLVNITNELWSIASMG